MAFIYTNNQLEYVTENAITVSTQTDLKYLGINLLNDVQNLCKKIL